MEDLIIRKATIEDLNDITNLNNKLFKLEKENYDDTLVENWPLSEDGNEYFQYVIVATINNKVIGYLAGSINEKGSYEEVQYGEINNMFIDEKYRKYGIGKKLINEFKDYCKDNKIYNIKVEASYKNKGAIEFYHKNGFNEFNLTLTSKIN